MAVKITKTSQMAAAGLILRRVLSMWLYINFVFYSSLHVFHLHGHDWTTTVILVSIINCSLSWCLYDCTWTGVDGITKQSLERCASAGILVQFTLAPMWSIDISKGTLLLVFLQDLR